MYENDKILSQLSMKSLNIIEQILNKDTFIINQCLYDNEDFILVDNKKLLLYSNISKTIRRHNKEKYDYLNLFYNMNQIHYFFDNNKNILLNNKKIIVTKISDIDNFIFEDNIIRKLTLPKDIESMCYNFQLVDDDSEYIGNIKKPIFNVDYNLNLYKKYILNPFQIQSFIVTLGLYDYLINDFLED